MYFINEAKRKLVLETLAAYNNDYARAAKKLHMKEKVIRWIVQVENQEFNMTESGKGRPELQKYIVAIKHRDECWDNTKPEIVEARKAYEDGIVELTSGKDGWNDILYAIPRRVRAASRPIFSTQEEDND